MKETASLRNLGLGIFCLALGGVLIIVGRRLFDVANVAVEIGAVIVYLFGLVLALGGSILTLEVAARWSGDWRPAHRQKRSFEKAFKVSWDHELSVKKEAVRVTAVRLLSQIQTERDKGPFVFQKISDLAGEILGRIGQQEWRAISRDGVAAILREQTQNWDTAYRRQEELVDELERLLHLAKKHGVSMEAPELARQLKVDDFFKVVQAS